MRALDRRSSMASLRTRPALRANLAVMMNIDALRAIAAPAVVALNFSGDAILTLGAPTLVREYRERPIINLRYRFIQPGNAVDSKASV